MIGEAQIAGVFIPRLILVFLLAFAASLLLRRILRWLHVYRYVWHAALFDIAVFVVLSWLIAAGTTGVTPYGVGPN
jgi:protein AaeX